ncbi:hypothetical protein [Skermania sp. ID1734]|uniref:hypothetical protein n=1 Tax=Skermania sp. ID1734 TaxID=2597516 RepID=UPI001C8F2390
MARTSTTATPTTATPTIATDIRLGLQANLPQFVLLVVVNALVGGLLGQERTVVPLLAGQVFACRPTPRHCL